MASWWLLAACALLAIPTSIDPGGAVAGATYLAGLTLIVMAMWWGTMRLPRAERRPWLMISAAGSCWLVGDVLQRSLTIVDALGPQDVFWLASYPLLIAAVIAMMRSRGMPAESIRGIRLDVIIVAVAAAVIAWRALIVPTFDDEVSLLTNIVYALYPLGDVAIFALALCMLMAPGSRGVVSALVVSCLGLTLPLDFLQTVLPEIAPSLNADRLDAALLIVNALLGAAALHPDRRELSVRPVPSGLPVIQTWRVILLGTALSVIPIVSTMPGSTTANLIVSVTASVVVSSTVVLRFYRVVREREDVAEALRHLAHHDQLTGVANRLLLMDRLTDRVQRDRTRTDRLVLVFVDLDGFKTINDTWGHAAGDEVLRVVARRLSRLVRPGDTVARVGGDEFAVLCHDVSDEHAEALGRRIRDAVCRPVRIGAVQVRVGASVGVLTVPGISLARSQDSVRTADELLRRADSAMYDAKRDGGGVRTTHPGPAAPVRAAAGQAAPVQQRFCDDSGLTAS